MSWGQTLYTARYADKTIAEFINAGAAGIGITLRHPRFKKGFSVKMHKGLAPSYAAFKNKDNEELFRKIFMQDLKRKHAVIEYRALIEIAEKMNYNGNIVLFCYEDLTVPNAFCHRTMVAEWFMESIGIDIKEWNA